MVPNPTANGCELNGRAQAVTDPAEGEAVPRLFMQKYPEQAAIPFQMSKPGEVRIFRLRPAVISAPDYTKVFAHTDLVTCWPRLRRSQPLHEILDQRVDLLRYLGGREVSGVGKLDVLRAADGGVDFLLVGRRAAVVA
jgi:hypothetical protein